MKRVDSLSLSGVPPPRHEIFIAPFRTGMSQRVLERDPAIEKLLHDLPAGDPDKHELAEIWLAFAESRPIVPVGVEALVKLGPWRGPRMPLRDVVIHARKLRTNEEATGRFGDEVGEAHIWNGVTIAIVVLVEE